MKRFRYVVCFMITFLNIFSLTACTKDETNNKYGVFIGLDRSQIEKLYDYDIVVIDAQYFTASDIELLHKNDTTVYSYLNIGSIEKFRKYYPQFQNLILSPYENWDDEYWIDVSAGDWQDYMFTLAGELSMLGIDGFFIDNGDVYDLYESNDIFEGLTIILKKIKTLEKPVIINGADAYVTDYMERFGSAADIMDGVNQESVFSSIDFDSQSYTENEQEVQIYFKEYIEACAADGMNVYLTEYTTDPRLIQSIKAYCTEKNFYFYIADSLELE